MLSKYKSAPLISKPNYLLIPVTVINADREGMEEWNKIFFYLKSLKDAGKITRTRSGGISVDRRIYRPPMWDCRKMKSCLELTILLDGGMMRIQFRRSLSKTEEPDPTVMPGRKALSMFASKLWQISGINLEDYAICNGLELREKEAPRYIVDVNPKFIRETVCIEDARTYYPVHHIDFHSSFPAGLANTHPEFRETIDLLYEQRKAHPEYKGCLNSTIGAMWSPALNGAKYARLAIDAINDNNRRINDITERLESSGRIPLVWNVDGVWYLGEEYHGEGEGPGLGQWENDHVNCKFRAKTRGSYEYIEDGVYYPVVRGIKNELKANWSWGSIFDHHEILEFSFDEERGIYLNETIKI